MSSSLDLNAKHYKKHSKTQYTNAQKLLEKIQINQDFSILDVGCGHGEIIAELSKAVLRGHCVGVDSSANMISLATELYTKTRYKNLEFHQAKAEEMKFQEASFDVVLCTNVLQWVRHPKKALNLMANFLKPKGHLVIFTYCKNTPYVRLFEKVLNLYFPELQKYSAVNTMLTPKAHEEFLLDCNFTFSNFKIEEIVFEYKDREEFKNYIKGWLTCYTPIPSEKQKFFLEKIIQASSSFNISLHPSKIAIPHKSLSIIAQKS